MEQRNLDQLGNLAALIGGAYSGYKDQTKIMQEEEKAARDAAFKAEQVKEIKRKGLIQELNQGIIRGEDGQPILAPWRQDRENFKNYESGSRGELNMRAADLKPEELKASIFGKGGARDAQGNIQYTPEIAAKIAAETDLKKAEAEKARRLPPIKPVKPAAPKKYTEAENKAGMYASDMRSAMDTLERIPYDFKSSDLKGNILKNQPFEFLKPENIKLQQNAERQFIDAYARYRTGAAMPPSEYGPYRDTLFPTSNDTPEVMAEKANKREQAFLAMKEGSGGKYDTIPRVKRPPGNIPDPKASSAKQSSGLKADDATILKAKSALGDPNATDKQKAGAKAFLDRNGIR